MPPLASCFRTNRKKGPYVRRTSKEKETNAELLFHCIFSPDRCRYPDWFVPQSVVVKNNGTKEIIYNAIMVEGKVVTGQGLQPMGLWDILMAPIRGFVKAAPVGFAILMAGSFLHLMNHVGAMNSAIGWLLKRFTGKA